MARRRSLRRRRKMRKPTKGLHLPIGAQDILNSMATRSVEAPPSLPGAGAPGSSGVLAEDAQGLISSDRTYDGTGITPGPGVWDPIKEKPANPFQDDIDVNTPGLWEDIWTQWSEDNADAQEAGGGWVNDYTTSGFQDGWDPSVGNPGGYGSNSDASFGGSEWSPDTDGAFWTPGDGLLVPNFGWAYYWYLMIDPETGIFSGNPNPSIEGFFDYLSDAFVDSPWFAGWEEFFDLWAEQWIPQQESAEQKAKKLKVAEKEIEKSDKIFDKVFLDASKVMTEEQAEIFTAEIKNMVMFGGEPGDALGTLSEKGKSKTRMKKLIGRRKKKKKPSRISAGFGDPSQNPWDQGEDPGQGQGSGA